MQRLRRAPLSASLISILVAAACGASPHEPAGRSAPPTTAADDAIAEVLWDRYGIPHVYAADDVALFRAFGWAQMESHGDLLLRLYGTARGRAAEYWGEERLPMDIFIRTMGVPDRGRQWLEAQDPDFRARLEAFAEGINAYARAHPERIADEVEAVLPVSAADVLAHVQTTLHLGIVTDPDLRRHLERWRGGAASAGWAVAPSRTTNGNALLLMNPHLPWGGPFTLYEAHLVGPDVDVYGTTLVGFPVMVLAFNQHLGWTHTVNMQDGQDLYELTVEDGSYRYDGAQRALETEDVSLRVRTRDGTLEERSHRIHRSVHGPVVATRRGHALALRMVGLDRPHLLEQWWEMGRSRSLAEFEAQLARAQLPQLAVVYADREGNILYGDGGITPARPPGDFSTWAGLVPGDSSAQLWTETLAYADMPLVRNPPSGWVQSSNDPPWWTSLPQALDPGRFPSHVAPPVLTFPRHFRSLRTLSLLSEERPLSFEDVVEMKHSTHLEAADRLLPDLIAAAREHPDPRIREAAGVLETWDRRCDADSRGAVLFGFWFHELHRRGTDVYATGFDPADPLAGPRGLADTDAAMEALATAVRGLGDRLAVPFGEVHRIRAGPIDVPSHGCDGDLGALRVVRYERPVDGVAVASGGDAFVAVVELGSRPRAEALLVYGNASQPGSPHRGDQLELFLQKRLRPVWLRRQEVESNLSRREVVR